jgi:hypothetical protein
MVDALRHPVPEGCPQPQYAKDTAMDEDRLNIAIRKFLKEVGVTSQREIERVIREGAVKGDRIRLSMRLTSEDAPLDHRVESVIDLKP